MTDEISASEWHKITTKVMGNVRHKYDAVQTERDGIKFASKLEAAYYDKLCMARNNGDLLFFLRQVPFHLPGGVRYVVDFVEFWTDGAVQFVDTKGYDTPASKTKRRLVEASYPIKIQIVSKA